MGTKQMNHTEYQRNLVSLDFHALNHIIGDCKQVIALQPWNDNVGYYTDEIHYCSAELRYRLEPKNAPTWRKRLGFK